MGNKQPTYYIDACVFISLIETPATEEPAKTIEAMLSDASDGKVRVVTSMITIAEVAFAKAELDKNTLDPAVEAKINSLWHPASPVKLVEVHELIAKRACYLLREGVKKGWSKTRAHDAIHLATAEREEADELITYDDAMKKWEPVIGLSVSEPHIVGQGNGPTLFGSSSVKEKQGRTKT